jgi:hypothetical protein
MADSEPAVYTAPVCTGLLTDRYGQPAALWIGTPMPLLAFATTRFLPAPRVREAR